MKLNTILVIVIVVILAIGGIFVWKIDFEKSDEGYQCKADKNCKAGLKCIMNICASGKIGSVCLSKADCKSGFCVENKCTEGSVGSPCQSKEDCLTRFCVNQKCTQGKEGDPCISYNDCDGLLCVNSACSKFSEKPNQAIFKEYFSVLRLGTVKEWPKEGPPPFQETNIFKLGEQICLDATVLKDVSPQAEIYNPYEEVVVVPRMAGGPGFRKGGNIGCSSMPSELSAGKKYEYKIYVGNTLVAVLPFEVIEK